MKTFRSPARVFQCKSARRHTTDTLVRSRARTVLPPVCFTQRRQLAAHTVNLLDELSSRGLVSGITRPEILKDALERPQVVYLGIDPTAKSLHAGHLLPLVCLLHFQIRGHRIVPLIGGATGLIGDPSGRSVERNLADTEVTEQNAIELHKSIETFFDRASEYAEKRFPHLHGIHRQTKVLNNLEWLRDVTLLDFLRTVGVSARVNTMLNRESVQTRMKTQQGISFTEFSYQLLQAYDFYTLHKHHGCSIQLGGSDQWGNVVAGIELINRLDDSPPPGPNHDHGEKAFGITTPLLTTASGQKFGKSAGNAVWLDDRLTSVFDFYQFFLRTADADVERYLKMFTLLPIAEINDVVESHRISPEKRIAQRLLADELTVLVHTQQGLRRAHVITKILFDSDYADLNAEQVVHVLAGDPRLVFCEQEKLFATPITKLAATFKLVSSSTAAGKLVKAGGLYLNNRPIRDVHFKVSQTDLLDGKMIVLRAGRDKHLILTWC